MTLTYGSSSIDEGVVFAAAALEAAVYVTRLGSGEQVVATTQFHGGRLKL